MGSTSAQTTTSTTVVTTVTYQGTELKLQVTSNSTISGLSFNKNTRLMNFTVSGRDGTNGFCSVHISKELLDGKPIVLLDGNQIQAGVSQDEANYYVYFTYNHSSHNVAIGGSNSIPEFLYALTTLLLVLSVLLFATKTKRRYCQM
jgi:hypothetical protein